jgi:hypothetical protein
MSDGMKYSVWCLGIAVLLQCQLYAGLQFQYTEKCTLLHRAVLQVLRVSALKQTQIRLATAGPASDSKAHCYMVGCSHVFIFVE